MNLAHILKDSLTRHPEKVVFEGDGRSLSYIQLDRLAENLAASLARLGYGEGSRIAVLLPNIPEYAVVVFGLWRLGAEPVLINPQLTGPELQYLLQDSGAHAVLLAEALLPVVAPLRSELPAVRWIIVGQSVSESDIPFAPLVATPGHHPIVERRSDAVAQVMYTSGTTGRPKGALLSHGNLLSNALAGIEVLDISAEDHLFCILPVFHAFAFTAALVILPLAGGSVTFEYRYNPKQLAGQLRDPRLSVMVAVPGLLATLLRFPEEFRLSTALRCILCGGDALPESLERQFAGRFGDKVRQGYGMTECSPYIAFAPLDRPSRPGSIGVCFPQGHQLTVRDPFSGAFLAPGEVGELVVRGPHIFQGYWNTSGATEEAFVDGWLRTGDLGYVDREGYYFLVDRLKDMLIVGGEKVYSREVEDVLGSFEPVREAAVIGDLDPDRGELVHAYVSLKEGATTSEEAVIAHARRFLSTFKVPRRVTILPELPKSATGKILKRELRKLTTPPSYKT